MKLYYSPAYTQSQTAYDTTRKAQWIVDSLNVRPLADVQLVAPRPLTVDQLLLIHTPTYVRAMRTGEPRWLASSSGFDWDAHTFDSVCASNGGVVQAVEDALMLGRHVGSLSSGIHHARAGEGNGLCTFNGLALAARTFKHKRLLIIDLDAHCGGGTYSLVKQLPNVVHLDISTCLFDFYPRPDRGLSTLDILYDVDQYFLLLDKRLSDLNDEEFDVIVYNAGMDTEMTLAETAFREQMVFEWADRKRIPVAFTMAGGYTHTLTVDQLVDLHRLTIVTALSSGVLV